MEIIHFFLINSFVLHICGGRHIRMKKIITQTIVVAFTAGSLMLTTACGGGEDEAAAEADAADAASEAQGDGEEEEPGGE